MSFAPLFRDLSDSEKWMFAIGSPNFVVVVEAIVPMKGDYDTIPVIRISSKMSPNNLEFIFARELELTLSKALEYASCIVRAARYEEKYISVGRIVCIRNKTGQYQIVGVSNLDTKEFSVRMVNSQDTTVNPVSLWDIIPVIEVTDS